METGNGDSILITRDDRPVAHSLEITPQDVIRLLDPKETWPIRVNGFGCDRKAYVQLNGQTTTISFTPIVAVEVSTADFFFNLGQLLPS